MKKFVFGLIATLMFGNLSFGQTFEESVIIRLGERTTPKDAESGKSARTFTLVNFNKNYKLLPSYVLNGVEFTDDGKYNDKISGDGIYTSFELLKNIQPKINITDYFFVSDNFQHNSAVSAAKVKVKVGCKIRYVRKGLTILGDNCATNCCGCLEIYDCEASIECEWEW